MKNFFIFLTSSIIALVSAVVFVVLLWPLGTVYRLVKDPMTLTRKPNSSSYKHYSTLAEK